MEHIDTRRQKNERHENEREIDVGATKAHCLPLVVWTRARGAIESCPERPLVVIVSKRTEGISTKIMNHFTNDGYKRWDRLCRNQAWLYLDLYFLFTKWDRVWGAVKHNLQTRTEQVHARRNVLPIIQQTRQLHKDSTMMISLREHVRIHKASLRMVMQRVEGMLGGVDWVATQALKGRLEDAYQLLEYYDVTAATLLEQQQNLLSLAFSLETVAQGQAVARLNALAFVFLPLSFVASVFGITTFTAPSKWYPVAAAAVLLSTVIIAYSAHQFFTSHASKDIAENQPAPAAATSDPENVSSDLRPITTLKNLSKIFRLKQNLDERPPLPETINHNSPNINDPSRLLRSFTDRSLAARAYIPPRSTVQFLPGAYESVANEPSYSYQYPSQQTYPAAAPGHGSYDFATGHSSFSAYSPQRPPQRSIYDPTQYPSVDIPYGQYDYSFGPHNQPQIMSEIGSSEVPQPYSAPSPARSPSPVRIQSASQSNGPPIPPRVAPDLDEAFADQSETLEIRKAVALFEFNSMNETAFHFSKGDIITVISRSDASSGWCVQDLANRVKVGPCWKCNRELPANRVEIIEPSSTFGIDLMSEAGVGYMPDDWGLPPEQNELSYTPASIVHVLEDNAGPDEILIRNHRLETIPESPATTEDS